MRLLPLICLVCLTLITQEASGQVPYFQKYLLKKNQPVQTNAFLQSKTGYLWLGTDKGLFKFDGITFYQYSTTDGIAEEEITTLAEDSVGRIWLGHKSGKISIFENAKATLFNPEEGLPTKPISKILFDRQGTLWFATLNDGLYYYRNNRLYRLDDIDGMPDIFVYDIAEDSKGNIWAGTDGGIAICSLTKGEVKITTISSAQGLPDNIVKKIKIGKDKAWLATEDAGVVSYDFQTKKITKVPGDWGHQKPIDLMANQTELWMASSHGIAIADYRTLQSRTISEETATCLFEDLEGNVWLGLKNGIARSPGKRIQFIRDENKKWDVLAVAVDKNKDTWFATAEGLFKRSQSGVTQKQLVNSRFANSKVISLFANQAGYVWVGLYDDGLLKIDLATGQAQQIKDGLANGSVLHISGNESKIWLATLGGASELTFSGGKTTIRNYHSGNGLSTDYIYQVFEDSKNRTWFATDRAGIDMLDKDGFHHFKGDVNSKVIYGFAEDGNHQIWANVQNAGLFVFDGSNFKPFGRQSLFRESNISDIITNRSGEIIVAHDSGIDLFNPSTDKFSYFGEESGIKDQSPNLNATFKDDLGKILIGSSNGIIVISAEGTSVIGPKPIIEELSIYNQEVAVSYPLDLKHDQNSLTIHFTGLWYQNPENVNFKFILESHDKDWLETQDHFTSYSQLPPGDYKFRVKASVSSDFDKIPEATLVFTISPPFWRTNAFYIFVILLTIFSGYSYIKYREKKLKAEKLELEKMVYERTMEIERNTEEIKAQAEEIQGINENLEALVQERTQELEQKNKALEEYAFINAHQLRSPVASILGLLNLMKGIELKDHEKECMDRLQVSAKNLDDVVSSITKAIEQGDYDINLPPDSTEFSE